MTHKHPFGTSKIQLQKDFSQSKEGLWQLKVDEGRKNLRAKLKPPLSTANFSEYLLTSGKWWVNKTTGERLISSQAWKQYLQRYLKICAAFQIWRVYSPRNAQTAYAHSFQHLSSKIHWKIVWISRDKMEGNYRLNSRFYSTKTSIIKMYSLQALKTLVE